MTFTFKLVLMAVVLVATLGVACGGGNGDGEEAQSAATNGEAGTTTESKPEQDASAFMKELTERSLRGQYGRNWESLHPAHQAVVTRDKYDSCERESNESTGATKISIDVEDTYEEPVRVEGEGMVDSTAVTLRLTYDNPLTGKPAEEHGTAHAVPVEGEWKWILTDGDYKAYAKGQCPPEE
jgi:hypothetical protein